MLCKHRADFWILKTKMDQLKRLMKEKDNAFNNINPDVRSESLKDYVKSEGGSVS